MMTARAPLKGLLPEELEALAVAEGARPFAGRQLAAWLYARGAGGFEVMTDLPAALREKLGLRYRLSEASVASSVRSVDGSVKLLVALADGERVESVVIPEPKRTTLCLSTQVGCARGCVFCATATMKLRRQLSAGEILDQVVLARRLAPVTNVVFMGMGEPLDNYDNVRRAAILLSSPRGFGLAPRHVTISTVGVVPRILDLARDRVPARLTISLTAPDDALRSELMPVNRRWPVRELMDAVAQWRDATGRDPTFAYVMLKGVNDDPARAEALAALARPVHAKVNLIPYNPARAFDRPDESVLERFRAVLERRGVLSLVRRERGGDVAAACGQLAVAAEA